MPIDRDKVLAQRFPEGEGGYREDDAILYALGVGAGVPATDSSELAYVYEKNLKLLPSFPTVVKSGSTATIFGVPGLDFDRAKLLHGEQEVVLHRPLPPSSALRGRGRIAEIYDKGKAALLILENEALDASGEPLFTTRSSLFLRGEGGFGGPSSPANEAERPERAPDGVLESTTLPQQALLYRLCGDKNPLHCDPAFAARGGFDRPILHGLCSFGVVCKALVDGVLGGDPTRVASWRARFRGIAYPGETFLTSFWQDGTNLYVEAHSKQRDAPILSNGLMTLR